MAGAPERSGRRGRRGRGARRQAHLVQLHRAGGHTIAELAELFAVSRPTVYRVLERERRRTISR